MTPLVLSPLSTTQALPAQPDGLSRHGLPACGIENPDGLPAAADKAGILNGDLAKPNQWPWVAALLCVDKFFCTASILNERWLLTAAHCVDTCDRWQVTVGSNTWRSPTGPYYQVIEAKRGFTIDSWDPPTFHNDIALIELAEDIRWNGEKKKLPIFVENMRQILMGIITTPVV